MAEGSREATGKSRKMAVGTNFLLEIDRFPRDLLRGFMSVSDDNSCRNSRYETIRVDHCTNGDGDGDGDDEIELNLGLSLGGRFGVDKTPGKLKRSSSVVGTMPILREQDEQEYATAARPSNLTYYTVGLTRTTSLPAETEEEWRKRKEIQTLRRMEAKKRRIGKQKTCSDIKDGFFQSQSSVDSDGLDGGSNGGGGGGGRGSCSSLSELDSKNQQGSSNSCGEECSPGFITHCSPCHETEKPCVPVTKPSETEKPAMRKCNSIDGRGKEGAATLNMPCVFTKGRGPNGRKIEGILYRYGKGEEVRIMCVCHGSFLSPAEFVRHAGGGDVDHPLRHIVVNTSSSISSLFL